MTANRIRDHVKNGNGKNGHVKNGNGKTAAPKTDAPAANGRDAEGRFAQGNPGGTGNPFARQVAELRKALVNRATQKDVEEIGDKLIALAKEGNVPAAKLVLAYLVGKPTPAPEPDLLAQHEWEIFRNEATFGGDLKTFCHRRGPEPNLYFARELRKALDMSAWSEMRAAGRKMLDQLERDKRRQKRKGGKHVSQPAGAGSYLDINVVAPSANGVLGKASSGPPKHG